MHHKSISPIEKLLLLITLIGSLGIITFAWLDRRPASVEGDEGASPAPQEERASPPATEEEERRHREICKPELLEVVERMVVACDGQAKHAGQNERGCLISYDEAHAADARDVLLALSYLPGTMIFFGTGKADVPPREEAHIDQFVQELAAIDVRWRILVFGSPSPTGSRDMNLALGTQRTEKTSAAVRRAAEEHGIYDKTQIRRTILGPKVLDPRVCDSLEEGSRARARCEQLDVHRRRQAGIALAIPVVCFESKIASR